MSDAINAEFRESTQLAVGSQSALANILPTQTADAMVDVLQEWERFKALAIRPEDWMSIPGVPGKYLPADAVDRIAPAIGLSWEIISKNEYGDPGVRATLCEALTYETKIIKKKAKGGGTYDAEVPDYTKPVKTLAMVYTVTVRCHDRFGRQIEVEGSFSSLEMVKSDYHARQQALTRARRVGSLKLIGGVDHDVFEEERARIESEKRISAERAAAVPSSGALYNQALVLGVATDGPSFRAWIAQSVPGCEGAVDPIWKPDVAMREAINARFSAIAEEREQAA
jgi:hypothetical protein